MNNKLILVKYASEIFLKGLNRGKFERKLKENIEKKLSGLQFASTLICYKFKL